MGEAYGTAYKASADVVGISLFPAAPYLDSTKQWAAVRTHCTLMRDPPHRCPVPETAGSWMLTSQGQAPPSAFLPPTTRVMPRSSSEVKGRIPQLPLQVENNFLPAPWLATAPAEALHKVCRDSRPGKATGCAPVHKELRLPHAVAWPWRTSGPSPGSPQSAAQAPSQSLGPLTRRCSTWPAQACRWPAGRGGRAAALLSVARVSCRSEASVHRHRRSHSARSTCTALSPGLMSQSSWFRVQALRPLAPEP